MSERKVVYVPITPGGTPCGWLSADTEDKAWRNLIADIVHMPYQNKDHLTYRGYTVEQFVEEVE